MKATLLLCLLCLPTAAFANHPKAVTCTPKAVGCDPAPHVRHPSPRVKHTTLGQQIVQGLEFTSGFRWEREHVCPPTVRTIAPPPRPRMQDPFYLGVGLRLPLSPKSTLGFAWDRDFTDAPNWQGRLYVSCQPFRSVR